MKSKPIIWLVIVLVLAGVLFACLKLIFLDIRDSCIASVSYLIVLKFSTLNV